MKISKFVALALIGSFTTSLYAVDNNTMKELKDLKKQIKVLNSKIDALENNQKSNEDDLDDLSDRVDYVETSTLMNKVNFKFEFRSRVDSFTKKYASGKKDTDGNMWSERLRLNLYSKVNDNMKFHGRLTMYKNWANFNTNPISNMDPDEGRRPNDSRLFVERAYVDWKVLHGKLPLILTIGRQPSSDGPSYEFRENTVRKGTYQALLFDGVADGIVATMPLNKVTKIDGMSVRLAYGKGYQSASSNSYYDDNEGVKDTDVLGFIFESSVNNIENSLFQLNAVRATNVVSLTTDKDGKSSNTNIGDVNLYGAMIQFRNFKNTNLDFFAQTAMSVAKPNGKTANQVGADGNNHEVGLLTNTKGDTTTKYGYAYWIGARYTLPFVKLNNPKIGIEYNHGSKYWFSFTQGSEDVTNKLATRGHATEIYYIQPINRYAYLRVGTQLIDYKYTGSGYQIGEPTLVSDNSNNLDKLTNTYLLFNLGF